MKKLYFDIHRALLIPSEGINSDEAIEKKSEKDARTTRLASFEAAQSASSSGSCLCPGARRGAWRQE